MGQEKRFSESASTSGVAWLGNPPSLGPNSLTSPVIVSYLSAKLQSLPFAWDSLISNHPSCETLSHIYGAGGGLTTATYSRSLDVRLEGGKETTRERL